MSLAMFGDKSGAAEETRTPDPIITNCNLGVLAAPLQAWTELANSLRSKGFVTTWALTQLGSVGPGFLHLPY